MAEHRRKRLLHGCRDLGVILLAAAWLRLALFSGFVLGDDPAYGDLVHQILESVHQGGRGGIPVAVDLNVFATRPLLLGLVAASIGSLGWTEFAFVLPVFLSSLVGIAAAYAIGYLVAGRRAALFSSMALALLPLDVVYATTMTNDIVVTACAGAGAALVLLSVRDERRRTFWFGGLGGVLIGLGVAVKVAALMLAIPLLAVVALAVMRRALALSKAAAIIGGWSVAQAAISVFFYLTAGDWLAHVRVEQAFNRAYMLQPYAQDRTAVLLTYPNWLLGLAPVGPINHLFFPFGLFLPIAGVCTAIAIRYRRRELGLLAVWFIAVLLAFEFMPLQIRPTYVPIHRLPRFLHPAMLPGTVLIGAVVSDAIRRSGWRRMAGVAACAVYAFTSVEASVAAAARHRDVMLDQRFAARIALDYSGPVAADPELLNFIRFRSGYADSRRLVALMSGETRSEPTLVILGGSRRIDLDPGYVITYRPTVIPPDWMTFAEMPGAPAPWRLLPGTVYVVAGGSITPDGVKDNTAQLVDACPAGSPWLLKDVIDVGDPTSESAHDYHIDSPSWSGFRTMLTNGETRTDDGRAFLGGQTFTVSGLKTGADLCVALRIDAGVQHQVTQWFAGDQSLARVDIGTLAANGSWRAKSLLVPGRFVAGTETVFREAVVSSDFDVNVFRVEVFQVDAGDESGVAVNYSWGLGVSVAGDSIR